MKKNIRTAILISVCLVAHLNAQVDTNFILGYDFGDSGNLGTSWVNPDNATAGAFVSGAGMTLSSSGVGANNSEPWVSSSSTGDEDQRAWFSDDVNSMLLSTSIAEDKYVAFSINADPGYFINPSQIGFLALTDANNSPESYQLWISTDGFTNFDGTETAATTILGNGSVTQERSGTSPQAFQLFTHDIVSPFMAEQVSARVYWYASEGTGGAAIRMDKVYMSGTTVIPEPGTLLLVGISLSALLLFRRKK